MANVKDRLIEVATPENAAKYASTDEKFIFCIDLLEISATVSSAEYWVNELEDYFDVLNSLKIEEDLENVYG